MNRASENILWRYAAERATSQRVVLPILILLALNSFPAGVFTSAGRFQTQLAVVLAASLAAWVFFTAVGALINLLCRTFSVTRVLLISFLYAGTEILRFGVIYQLSGPLREVDHSSTVFNVVNAASTGLVLFGVLSIAVTDYTRYCSSHSALVQQTKKLQETLTVAEITAEQTRSEIVEFVRRQLAEDLSSAKRMGDRSTSHHSGMVDELFRIADEVVRPLSHELSYTPEVPLDLPVINKPARVPLRTLLREASIAAPFKPAEVTFLIALLTAPLTLVYSSPASTVLWVVFMVLVFGVSWLGRKYLTPRLASWPFLVRVIVTTSVFALPVAFYIVFVIAPEFSGPRLGPLWFVFALLIGVFLAALVSISGGVRVARTRSLNELREVEAHLHWLNIRAQSRLWLDQKRLALTLHNEVQGALLAAALKLRYAIESGDDLVDQVMPEVQAMVQGCIDVQLLSSRAETLQQRLTQLNDTWAELIMMHLNADDEVVHALEADGLALEIVGELMREFQINSLKYGRATTSTIELTRPALNTVLVRLSNNGGPLEDGALGAGLGTRFLQSVALTHEIRNVDAGVQLVLEIPLQTA